MKVCELIEACGLEVVCSGDLDREITGGYTGDLLSWVMGCVQEGQVWVTIMTNQNVVAVALLRDVAAVVLAENAEVEAAVVEKAAQENITILRSEKSAFALSHMIGGMI